MRSESPLIPDFGAFDHSWLLVAAVVVTTAVGMGIGAFVLYRARHSRFSVPKRAIAAAVVWSLPVVLVLVGFATMAIPHFQSQIAQVRRVEASRDRHEIQSAFVNSVSIERVTSREASNLQKDQPKVKATETSMPLASDLEIPQWVGLDKQKDGDTTLLALTSHHFANVEDAEKDAFNKAAQMVELELDRDSVSGANWSVPSEILRNHCIRDRYVEKVERQMGSVTAELYRVHLLVQLSPKTREKLNDIWAQQVVENRMWVLGSFVGLATLILGTISSYFRLDALTQGSFRGRLKLASVSIISAGGLIAWAVVPT